jgi:hypothetical protein
MIECSPPAQQTRLAHAATHRHHPSVTDQQRPQTFDEYVKGYAKHLADRLPPMPPERQQWWLSILEQSRRERAVADERARQRSQQDRWRVRIAREAQAQGRPLSLEERSLLSDGDCD